VDRDPREAGVLRIARTYHLSVYHSAYLELAARTGFPLATLDKALASAALEELVTLVGEP
jgi:predicted nucleic acid-binding protein